MRRVRPATGLPLLIAVVLAGCSGSDKKLDVTLTVVSPPPPPSRADVDKRTHDYVHKVKACRLSVEWVIADTFRKTSGIEVAEETTNARDLCKTVRSQLLTMNTDQFERGAKTVRSGVGRYERGLNAVFAFAENPDAVGKIIEATVNLRVGDQHVTAGLKQINARRRVYNLKPIPVRD
jgi:hypothetical protein